MRCGIPIERPALGVNRLCGSGFQSIVNGAQVSGTQIYIIYISEMSVVVVLYKRKGYEREAGSQGHIIFHSSEE